MPKTLTIDDVETLRELRNRFGRSARRRKLNVLRRCASCEPGDARVLRKYHDTLLFIVAHPDDRVMWVAAGSELRRAAAAGQEMMRRGGRIADTRRLAGAGMPGTTIEYSFTIDALSWLAQRYPRDIEMAWDDGWAGTTLDDLLYATLPRAERDSMMTDRVTTFAGVRRIRPPASAATISHQGRLFGPEGIRR